MDKLLFILTLGFILASTGARAIDDLRYELRRGEQAGISQPHYTERLGRNEMRKWVLIAGKLIEDFE